MKIKYLILLVIGILINVSLKGNEISFYYPWNNRIFNLTNNYDNMTVPILLNGDNLRILEIKDFQGDQIDNINIYTENCEIEVAYLPVIEDYKNRKILDLIIPITSNFKFEKCESTRYFLIKFRGITSGSETIHIEIKTNHRKYHISKEILVSEILFQNQLHLNVWAYFDYNFLMKDMKEYVINDLFNHYTDVLVIPPFYIPAIGNVEKERILKLKEYLIGTNNKFNHYILFLGYDQNSKYIMSKSWKEGVPKWYTAVLGVFKELGISNDKLLIYPYDEPKGTSVDILLEMHSWFKKNRINIPFFCTIGNKAALPLAKKLDVVQVYSGNKDLVEEINRIKSPNTSLWIYEIPAGSRNIEANLYQRIGIKAFSIDACGIGFWNYSDVRLAFDEINIKKFQRGQGSWEILSKNPVRDYSVIYRKGDKIYSSLRWEALVMGMQDNVFLRVYGQRNGIASANILAQHFLSNKITPKDWEKIKIDLFNNVDG